jgi:DMSO reductase anchor subunit
LGSEILFLVPPLAVATVAVCSRRWSLWAYWGTALVLGAALCALWFRIANVGQPVVAPVFVVLFPVVATFWVVSRRDSRTGSS